MGLTQMTPCYFQGYVAMMDALRSPEGFERVIQCTKNKNFDPSMRGPGGWTPLMQAMLFGNVRAITLLAEKGARAYAETDTGTSAMLWAFWIGAERVLKTLQVRPGEGMEV